MNSASTYGFRVKRALHDWRKKLGMGEQHPFARHLSTSLQKSEAEKFLKFLQEQYSDTALTES